MIVVREYPIRFPNGSKGTKQGDARLFTVLGRSSGLPKGGFDDWNFFV